MLGAYFVSLRGQDDNLGDLVIRRILMHAAQAAASHLEIPVHAYVGDLTSDYVAGCQPASEVHLHRVTRAWLTNIIACRRPVHVASPGPVNLGAEPRSLVQLAKRSAVAAYCGLRGGTVAVGQSYEGGPSIPRTVESWCRRKATLNGVRDRRSQIVMGARLMLDLSFLDPELRGHQTSERRHVAASFRGDGGAVVERATSLLLQLREACGLDVVLVTQVRRDGDVNSRIADAIHADHIAWEAESHTRQLGNVIACYRHARFVVSNRLHANLFGFQCGAIPLLLDVSGGKVAHGLEALLRIGGQWADCGDLPRNGIADALAASSRYTAARDAINARSESMRVDLHAALVEAALR